MGFPDAVLRSRIFDGLTDRERERWLERAVTSPLERGHALARQGEPASHFYLLESLLSCELTQDGTGLSVASCPANRSGCRRAPIPIR